MHTENNHEHRFVYSGIDYPGIERLCDFGITDAQPVAKTIQSVQVYQCKRCGKEKYRLNGKHFIEEGTNFTFDRNNAVSLLKR